MDDSKHHAGNNDSPGTTNTIKTIGFAIAAAQPVFLIGSRSRCAATVFVGLGRGMKPFLNVFREFNEIDLRNSRFGSKHDPVRVDRRSEHL